MKVRQYVYFGVWRETVDARQMADWIGIEPDKVRVRGTSARSTPERPIPKTHSWQVHADPSGYIGEQVEVVLARIQPARGALRALIAENDVTRASLEIVRYFGDEDGQEQTGAGFNPFGWHLTPDTVQFLAYIGAEIDVDEYDFLDDEDEVDGHTR